MKTRVILLPAILACGLLLEPLRAQDDVKGMISGYLSESKEERLGAIFALTYWAHTISCEESAQVFAELLNDTDPEVVEEALFGLTRLSPNSRQSKCIYHKVLLRVDALRRSARIEIAASALRTMMAMRKEIMPRVKYTAWERREALPPLEELSRGGKEANRRGAWVLGALSGESYVECSDALFRTLLDPRDKDTVILTLDSIAGTIPKSRTARSRVLRTDILSLLRTLANRPENEIADQAERILEYLQGGIQ